MENYDTQRVCDHAGCTEVGHFRAPRARDRLNEFYWFCLEHVREYNRSWNYCAGMSTEQIEADIRLDSVWRRPTWRFGGHRTHGRPEDFFEDPFEVSGFGERPHPPGSNGETKRGSFWSPATPQGRAAAVLELEGEVSLAKLKARYKELAKKHHPDANGGCKQAEERLKSINEAYATLRKSITA